LLLALLVPTGVEAQQQLGEQLSGRSFNLMMEAGWRYPLLGQNHVVRDDDWFPLSYHGAVTTMIGKGRGFYAQARFDGFGPTGQGPYPFMLSGRVGYFLDVHGWDAGGPRSHSSSWTSRECRQVTTYTERCTTTRHTRTYNWWEPAGWVNGARYFYAGYRNLFHVEGDTAIDGTRPPTNPGAVVLGIGIIQSKFGTFLNEVELHYFVHGWSDEDRSRWGFRYHGQVLFGPAFLDFELLLDAGLGSEVSLGLGFVISP